MVSVLGQAVLEAVTRICELERRAVPESLNAVPHTLYAQSEVPYWTNLQGNLIPQVVTKDAAEFEITVTLRLIVAHVTEGYEGDSAMQAWAYAPDVVLYFSRYPKLIDQPGQAGIRYLSPRGCTIEGRGLFVYANPIAHDIQQFGVQFDLVVPFNVSARA